MASRSGMFILLMLLGMLVLVAGCQSKTSTIDPTEVPSTLEAIPIPSVTVTSSIETPLQTHTTTFAPFVWEEYGIAVSLPEGWQAVYGNGEDYELALASPEAYASGDGVFITLQSFVGLGAHTTLESILEPIAAQIEGEIEPYHAAGLEGIALHHLVEEESRVYHFILLPYGMRGDAMYFQIVATPEEDTTVLAILESMIIDPPHPDYAAIDAAWQTSLAENGTLVFGDPDAPIKMREYSSFTCGHCVRYSRTIERLIVLEVASGRVQLEMAVLAGDSAAQNATQALYCATEQGKGYSVHEALFQGYMDQEGASAYSLESINDLLSIPALGLDMEALTACMNDGTYTYLFETVRTSFTDHGLTGTPTVLLGVGDDPVAPLFLEGQVWSGAIPLSALRTIFTAVIEEGMTITEIFGP